LIVAGKDQIVGELSAHEALMVVRRRIDKMAQDLPGRPLTVEAGRGARFRQRAQGS
jgi:hypothetical protein